MKWNKLKLTEDKQSKIDIREDVVVYPDPKEACSVIWKLFCNRRINNGVIRSTMLKLWKVDCNSQFQEISPNTFISIVCPEDKERIYSRRPCFFIIIFWQ